MSLPPVFANNTAPLYQSGIYVQMIPSTDPSFGMELQRSVGSTASTNFSKINEATFLDGARALSYFDELPFDGVARYYRARLTRGGWTAGNFTRIVGARPGEVVIGPPPSRRTRGGAGGRGGTETPEDRGIIGSVPLGGNPISSPVAFTTRGTLPIKTAVGAAGALSKTLRIPYAEFIPSNDNNTPFTANQSYLTPRLAGSTYGFFAPVVLPRDTTITGLRCRGLRNGSSAQLAVDLFRNDSTAGFGSIASITMSTSTSYGTGSAGAFSQANSSVYSFCLRAILKNGVTGGVGRLQWVELDYTMSDYRYGI